MIKCFHSKSACVYISKRAIVSCECVRLFFPAISITRCSSSLSESQELKSALPDGPRLGNANLFIRKQTWNLCPALFLSQMPNCFSLLCLFYLRKSRYFWQCFGLIWLIIYLNNQNKLSNSSVGLTHLISTVCDLTYSVLLERKFPFNIIYCKSYVRVLKACGDWAICMHRQVLF